VLLDLIGSLVEVGLHCLDELVEGATITRLDVSDGEAGAVLPASHTTEASLVLHDAIGNAHLAAKSGEEENELDGIDVIGDADQLRLLFLHERRHGVNAVADHGGALGGGVALAIGAGLGTLAKTILLLLLGLGAVLVQKLEQLGGCSTSA